MRFNFNGKIALLLVAILASLILAGALSKDSHARPRLLLGLLASAAGIFILNSRKNIILPSGHIVGRVVGVRLIRRSPCWS